MSSSRASIHDDHALNVLGAESQRPTAIPTLLSKLKTVPLLQSLDENDLKGLSSRFTHVTLPTGSVLLSVGQVNSYMYILISGRLRIHLGKLDTDPIAYISPGETVGELSVIDKSPTSAHVVADGDCALACIDEQGFWNLVALSHHFSVQIMRKLAQRLRANNAAVMETAQRRDEFRQQALVDGLTGINNRRWLDDFLPRIVERHRREGRPLCVGMVDVDHFKRFNDEHGHDAGDSVLKAVASKLHDQLRPADIVARYGGEEFVLIFPDTDLFGAQCAAERLRKAVEVHVVTGRDASPLPSVTISIGLAKLDALAPQSLLSAGDNALYRAKERGRNRVECAPTTGEVALQAPLRSNDATLSCISRVQDSR